MLREPAPISVTSFTVKDHALPTDNSFIPGPGLVSRVRNRLFPPKSPGATADSPLAVYKHKAGFKASIAEMLLVSRLRARNHGSSDAGILERATQVIFVTCKYWFSAPQDRAAKHKTHSSC